MTLAPPLREHKALLAVLVVLGHAAARELRVVPGDTVDAIARAAGIQRTYVYEVLRRVTAALLLLAATGPGRPRRSDAEPDLAPEASALSLTVVVLTYRLEHPGALLAGGSGERTVYSPAFRRFILEQHDAWPHLFLADFARAVGVPLDTLRDWIEADRQGLAPPLPPPPPAPRMPENPAPLVEEIAACFARWQGSTRAFLGYAAAHFGLNRAALRRALILLGLIPPPRPRHLPSRPRHRGETERLSPGAVLVTDGKEVVVHLEASGREERRTLQPMVDQATACVTGIGVSLHENAATAVEAYRASVAFLGGRAPRVVLHDGKPCYGERAFLEAIAPATPLPATPGRGENKAVIEGFFGLFAQEMGDIHLDDSSPEALLTSVVGEVLRGFVAGGNHAARAELGGRSRAAYLRNFIPSPEQRERDRRFLEGLRARHARPRRARVQPASLHLLDEAFARHECLAGKDARGALRRRLACCDPSAIRQALALFAAKVEQGAIDADFAHRYLAALVKGCRGELELQRCEAELLDLAAAQGRWWTAELEEDLRRLETLEPLERAREIAARAAFGGLPVEGAFWTQQLLACVHEHPELAAPLRRHLVRLYEEPEERRLALLDLLAAWENGLR